MKKLLFVLLVVALASFLLVGCMPTTPAEGEGEGETVTAVCPIVSVTSQVAIEGKTYIKGGTQTITVEFAVPTEPISVYVGGNLKNAVPVNNNPEGVPDNAVEVIMYPDAEKKIYTGTFNFLLGSLVRQELNGNTLNNLSCSEDYIYVLTCNSCAPCKYPYIVDSVGPKSVIEISNGAICSCEGCTIEFDSQKDDSTCNVTTPCCGDDCSGFASYAIDLYLAPPFNDCCEVPCITPEYSCPGGVACPIDCTLTCITGTTSTTDKVYYAVVTLLDNVGNKTRYYATLALDSACGLTVQEYVANVQDGLCSDYTDKGSYSEQEVTTANPAEIGFCLKQL